MDKGVWQATVHGVTRVRYNLATKPPTTKNSTKKQKTQHLFVEAAAEASNQASGNTLVGEFH